jgi:DNA adenine methylase
MKPFLKWAGGKRWLVRRYPQLFDIDFDRYSNRLSEAALYFFTCNLSEASYWTSIPRS